MSPRSRWVDTGPIIAANGHPARCEHWGGINGADYRVVAGPDVLGYVNRLAVGAWESWRVGEQVRWSFPTKRAAFREVVYR